MSIKTIYILLFTIVLTSCAQTGSLSGGKKDVYAPSMDSSKTYPLPGSVNYSGSDIEIRFNEYIKLSNASENIIITPQQKTKADYSAKNKTFKLHFKDTLQENTTYVVNFNGAIVDITEGNDSIFQFVFSTGNYIDSLKIQGQVKNAYSNQVVDNCLIALYPYQSQLVFDSIPYKLKPTYIGQTNNKGYYVINYLKPGKYHLFALTDLNKNLKLDPDEELIGFSEMPYIELNDSLNDYDLHVFKIKSNNTRLNSSEFTYPGRLELVYNQAPNQIKVWSNHELIQEKTEREDSLIFWINEEQSSGSFEFYLSLNQEKPDTIRPFLKNQPEDVTQATYLTAKNNINTGKILPNQPLIFTFDEPILSVDTTKIHFLDADSNQVNIDYEISVNQLSFNTLNQTANQITLDSAAVTSIYKHSTKSALNYTFEMLYADSYYGTLIVNIDSIKSPIYLEVLDEQKNLIQSQWSDGKDSSKIFTFTEMAPGKYQLRLVEDEDQSKDWTPGDLKQIQQPESVHYYTDEIKVRSKWDLEIEWVIDGK